MNEALGLMQSTTMSYHLNDIGEQVGDYGHMMDGVNMWLWMLIGWLVLVVIAFLVYRDAEGRQMNGLLWFVLILLPWIGFLFLIIYLIVRDDRHRYEMTRKEPEAIISERYARGEIGHEEYSRMKENLRGGGGDGYDG